MASNQPGSQSYEEKMIERRKEKEMEERFAKDAEIFENGELEEREPDYSTYGRDPDDDPRGEIYPNLEGEGEGSQ